jgi:hypothetical protein
MIITFLLGSILISLVIGGYEHVKGMIIKLKIKIISRSLLQKSVLNFGLILGLKNVIINY